jgi:hypothetical protein
MKKFSLLALLITVFIFISYLYYGVTHEPMLGDSHDYHLPIARSFLNGQFLWLPHGLNPSIYYPGSSNGILAIFLFLHIPVNWFCLLGWVILFFLLIKLGRQFGLSDEFAVVYGMSFCAIQSILRQIPTQSIDVWIAVFFVWTILLLENPKRTVKYFLLLGFAIGMIIGSKASGPLYVIVVAIVYWKKILQYISIKRLTIFVAMVCVFGFFWYIRNTLQFGNPLYPADFPWMKGYPNFPLQGMLLYKTPFEQNGVLRIAEALISEYLIWAISPIIIGVYYFNTLRNKNSKKDALLDRVSTISLLTVLVSLLLPIPTLNIISNMRYLFPLFIPLMLGVFILAQKYKWEEDLSIVAVLNVLGVMYNIPYHPKLIMIFYICVAVVLLRSKNYPQPQQYIRKKQRINK